MCRPRRRTIGKAAPPRGLMATDQNASMKIQTGYPAARVATLGVALVLAIFLAVMAGLVGISRPASAQTVGPAASAPAPVSAPAPEAPGGNPPVAVPGPLKPIPSLELPRYMGRWYELARYPNRFQKDCRGAATADYRLLPGGTVEVVNRCPRADGSQDQATGEARRVGAEGSAVLEVRFAPAWLSFLPFVWGDYWVVELDAAYQLAVVSEPQREYLWVLSREPSLPASQWQALEARLRTLGFEPARLIRSGAP